jgi:hypothetical protein
MHHGGRKLVAEAVHFNEERERERGREGRARGKINPSRVCPYLPLGPTSTFHQLPIVSSNY